MMLLIKLKICGVPKKCRIVFKQNSYARLKANDNLSAWFWIEWAEWDCEASQEEATQL